MSISKFLLVLYSVDILALSSHLHEKIGIIIWFLGVEGNFFRLIDLEILIDFFTDILFV
jgi:hypothetical protein